MFVLLHSLKWGVAASLDRVGVWRAVCEAGAVGRLLMVAHLMACIWGMVGPFVSFNDVACTVLRGWVWGGMSCGGVPAFLDL